MKKPRTLPPTIVAPSHNNVIRDCLVMTEVAVHTMELPEGHFVGIVLSNPDPKQPGVVYVLDGAEVQEHMRLINNAIEDAVLLDAGLPPKHSTHEFVADEDQ